MPSHEWPLPPPPPKSSSSRRKITSEALAAVDWNKPHRFESYSDGEDEFPSPHAREPLESACQSSGYGDIKRIHSSPYRDNEGFQSFGNNKCNCLQACACGGDLPTRITKIIPLNKEAKVKLPVNRRVDHTSLAPQQTSAPLKLNTCPFSGPLKFVGRTNPNRSIMPAHVTDQKTRTFDPREPCSPEVTCLGRVRFKEYHGNNTEISIAENDNVNERHTGESKKQSVNRNRKVDEVTVCVDTNHVPGETRQTSKSSSRNEAGEKRGCLARRKRRGSESSIAVSDNTQTRRERASALARSLTSLLEDLRKLEMQKNEYQPAVPPPNSLLLMRGNLRGMDKSRVQEISMALDVGDALADTINNGSNRENRFGKDLCMAGMKMKMERSRVPEQVALMNAHTGHALAPQVLPLSEIQSNSLAQSASLSELKSERPADNCKDRQQGQELALWERRAIAKLASIDIKIRTKMALQRPVTG